MESRTHIDSLSDDLLMKATDIRGNRDILELKYSTPVPTPLATESAPINFLLASVCRRWRRVAQHHLHPHVAELLLRENLVASLQDLTVAVARFPSLTHLHLCDLSVENLDDAFFAHLASSCPKLTILHVGGKITPRIPGLSDEHPITDAGMDLFFRRCSQLQQLSLYCLRDGADFPPSFFQLKHLHTLALTTPATLENPGFRSLSSLTNLHLAFPAFHLQHLSSLLDLPIAHLSIFALHRTDQPAAPFSIALLSCLETLRFTNCTPPFDSMFPPRSTPCARLQQLLLTDYQELEGPPNDIGDLLPSLRKLVIRGCHRFTELPESLPSLTRLEELVISDAKFLFGLPDSLSDLPALKTLVLKSLPLVVLPSSLSQLTSLNALVLDNCYQLRELPPGLCRLPALKALCIERLRNVTLPDDIGHLTSLATLRFIGSRCQQHLPASFTALTALTSLQLHECATPELPDALGALSNLTDLSILVCPISRLPESITRLIRLERLAVVLCSRLSWVPGRLDSLKRLKQQQLTHCEGLSHPPAILPRSLELLSIPWSGNQLTALADVSVLSQLRELELHIGRGGQGPGAASCPASDLQVGAPGESSLRSLSTEGHCWSSGLSRLHRLALHLDNAAVELPFPLTFLPSLRRLTISGHGIRRLPGSIGAAFPQLRQLRLEQMSSLEEVPGSIGELWQLTALEIHAPRLKTLPETIGALSRLRTLDLSECRELQQLPACITRLACLHDLDSSSTSISVLPAGFAHLTRLRSLSLKHCRELQGFPEDFTQLAALRYLLLSSCRSDYRDTEAWLTAHGLAKLRSLLVML
ncbi:unnamed protein product [Closterium sp. NIES-65]|nr:unnamed protein product [Closterium sp. NIES-65]